MYIVLGIVGKSPYRASVENLAQDVAGLMSGSVRLAVPMPLQEGEVAAPSGPAEEGVEALVARVEEEASGGGAKTEAEAPREVRALHGEVLRQCIRELAGCDLGVVGKTLNGELPSGQGLGRDVARLKRGATKPLVIVPETVRPVRKALFVHTDHSEAGHALELAPRLARAGVTVRLLTAIAPTGRSELAGTAAAYLEAHGVEYTRDGATCPECYHHDDAGGPVAEVLHTAEEEDVDLIVMGGTHRGLLGRLLWPEMAYDVVWNAGVPVLVWY